MVIALVYFTHFSSPWPPWWVAGSQTALLWLSQRFSAEKSNQDEEEGRIYLVHIHTQGWEIIIGSM